MNEYEELSEEKLQRRRAATRRKKIGRQRTTPEKEKARSYFPLFPPSTDCDLINY